MVTLGFAYKTYITCMIQQVRLSVCQCICLSAGQCSVYYICTCMCV